MISPQTVVRILLLAGPQFGQRLAQMSTELGRPMRQGGAASTIGQLVALGYVAFDRKEPPEGRGQGRQFYRLTVLGRKVALGEVKMLRALVKTVGT